MQVMMHPLLLPEARGRVSPVIQVVDGCRCVGDDVAAQGAFSVVLPPYSSIALGSLRSAARCGSLLVVAVLGRFSLFSSGDARHVV